MGFLLDTCTVSELVLPVPNQGVIDFRANTPDDELFLSSISIAEVQRGITSLKSGSRRQGMLQRWLDEDIIDEFGSRILSFDHLVAQTWANVWVRSAASGHTLPYADSQIAATAFHHGHTVVTRNVSDFPSFVPVLNPWI